MIPTIVFGVLGLISSSVHIGMLIRQNRQARKHGKPVPNNPAQLAKDGLDIAQKAVNMAEQASE